MKISEEIKEEYIKRLMNSFVKENLLATVEDTLRKDVNSCTEVELFNYIQGFAPDLLEGNND